MLTDSRRIGRYAAVLLPLGVGAAVAPRITTAFLMLVLVPGTVIGRWSGSMGIGAAVGAGVAMLVLFLSAVGLAGISPSLPLLVAYGIGAAVLLVRERDGAVPAPSLPTAALGAVVGAAVATRLVPVAGMHAPLFADPAVEATLARLILEHGFPATWAPLADMAVNHQPGFAFLAAGFSAVSGVALPRTVLVLSALVHGLFPLSVAALGHRFLTPWRAVGAALVATMAAFPALTFMVGMNAMNLGYVLLPLLLAVAVDAGRTWTRRRGALLLLLGTGTALVHPVALVLTAVLLAPWLLLQVRDGNVRPAVDVTAAGFVLPAAAGLPYYLRTAVGVAGRATEQWALQSDIVLPGGSFHLVDVVNPLFTLFHNTTGGWYTPLARVPAHTIPLRAPVGTAVTLLVAWAGWRAVRDRDRAGTLFLGWYGLLLLLGPVQAAVQVAFPGWQYVYPSRALFLMALPVALLLARGLPARPDITVRDLSVPAAAVVLLLLAPATLGSVVAALDGFAADPVVTDADREAMRWMDENLGDDALVLNQVVDVEAGAFVGDAGQWIPAYTGSAVLYPATSLTGNVSGLQDRLAMQEAVRERDADRFARLADRYGITHIYITPSAMGARRTVDRFDAADVRAVCDCTAVHSPESVTVYRVTGARSPRG